MRLVGAAHQGGGDCPAPTYSQPVYSIDLPALKGGKHAI
jgi:hypothetical protein